MFECKYELQFCSEVHHYMQKQSTISKVALIFLNPDVTFFQQFFALHFFSHLLFISISPSFTLHCVLLPLLSPVSIQQSQPVFPFSLSLSQQTGFQICRTFCINVVTKLLSNSCLFSHIQDMFDIFLSYSLVSQPLIKSWQDQCICSKLQVCFLSHIKFLKGKKNSMSNLWATDLKKS